MEVLSLNGQGIISKEDRYFQSNGGEEFLSWVAEAMDDMLQRRGGNGEILLGMERNDKKEIFEESLDWRDEAGLNKNVQAYLSKSRRGRISVVFRGSASWGATWNTKATRVPIEKITPRSLTSHIEDIFDKVSRWGSQDLTLNRSVDVISLQP